MKVLVIVCVALLATALYMQFFTSTDFTAKFSSFRPQDYRRLGEGVQNEKMEVVRISEQTSVYILYDSLRHYFLLIDNERMRKVDSTGHVIFEHPRKDFSSLRSEFAFWPHQSSYFFDTTGVFDMSADKPAFHPYDQVIEREDWSAWFDAAYPRATTVIFGPVCDDNDRRTIYLQIDSAWTLLYASANDKRSSEDDDLSGYRMEGYPARYQHLWWLKDTERGEYSTMMHDKQVSQQGLNYPTDPIKILHSRKTQVFSHAAYSPFPITREEEAAYRMGDLEFKASATRDVGFGKPLETYLRWFRLPDTKVSFMKYEFPIMGDEERGVYVVRPKQ
jgi:hypothetical protein